MNDLNKLANRQQQMLKQQHPRMRHPFMHHQPPYIIFDKLEQLLTMTARYELIIFAMYQQDRTLDVFHSFLRVEHILKKPPTPTANQITNSFFNTQKRRHQKNPTNPDLTSNIDRKRRTNAFSLQKYIPSLQPFLLNQYLHKRMALVSYLLRPRHLLPQQPIALVLRAIYRAIQKIPSIISECLTVKYVLSICVE